MSGATWRPEELEELEREALGEVEEAHDLAGLDEAERLWLGRKSRLSQQLKGLPLLAAEDRPDAGRLLNASRSRLETAFGTRRAALEAQVEEAGLATFDPSVPGPSSSAGSFHPVTLVRRELEAVFRSMGFTVAEGPEVETARRNFDALNIPADHPARDVWDTFWCDGDLVLRTHTSPVQIRVMESQAPPIYAVAPGRCFRNETVDASHDHTFHQMEGLVVDRGINASHMVGTLHAFLEAAFRRKVEVRLRPGYFPFVEPGFELDICCLLCEGGGCPVCKRSGWVELVPCGMVHPEVLSGCGIDAQEFTGFAFGLGLSRLAMMRYRIEDIRHLMAARLPFLEQFTA